MGTLDFTDSIYDAQQGSQSAIKFIYDNTIHLFYKEACVFMRDRNEADLAVQDAYDFIFSHLDSLEDSSRFLVWANEVCKNTCISRLKQAGAFDERIPAEAANLGEISPSADYDHLINSNASMPPTHVQACLDAILNSLPDNQRASAILWGEGYPVRSISRKLGISRAAVNYTLAYALGNITNSVTTLKENGLPLYSMEPIPYFLWLLISYYQYYQPDNLDTLVYSGFTGVLRRILPEEASIFAAEYSGSYPEDTAADADEDDLTRVHHVPVPEGNEPSAAAAGSAFAQSLDLSEFITAAPQSASEKSESPSSEEPDLEIYPAHPDDADKASDKTDSDDKPDGSDEPSESGDTDSEDIKTDEDSETPEDTDAAAAAGISAEASDTEKPADTPETPVHLLAEDQPGEEKKRHTGLLIALIIIAAVVLIIAAAMIFGGNTLKKKVNDLLGTNLFHITENITVPETTEPETTTEEPTTPEPTTEEPTTPEPTTTEEETTTPAEPSLPYDVTIYADGIALGMRAVPGGDDGQPRLTYIPSDTQITIDEIQNGWGHTVYSDEDGTYDGWIWMGFTRIVDNAPVEKPTEYLETPEEYIVNDLAGTAELRTGPGSSYSTFGPVPDGTVLSVEAHDAGGAWGYTSYNGRYGWIALY